MFSNFQLKILIYKVVVFIACSQLITEVTVSAISYVSPFTIVFLHLANICCLIKDGRFVLNDGCPYVDSLSSKTRFFVHMYEFLF